MADFDGSWPDPGYIPRTPNQVQRFLADAQMYLMAWPDVDGKFNYPAWCILADARDAAVEEPEVYCERCGRLGANGDPYQGAYCDPCLMEADYAMAYGATERYDGSPSPIMGRSEARRILHIGEE